MAKPKQWLAARPKSATGRGKVHVIADGIEISSCFDSGKVWAGDVAMLIASYRLVQHCSSPKHTRVMCRL